MKSIITLVFASFMVFGFISDARATSYVIADNATGRDCEVIGNWDWPTKTCTLTASIIGTNLNIFIKGDGIVLDGNGYEISGTAGYSPGVFTFDTQDVIIRNIMVSGYGYGISVSNASNVTVENTTLQGNRNGAIDISTSSRVSLLNSTFGGQLIFDRTSDSVISGSRITGGRVYVFYSNNLLIDNNYIEGTSRGVYVIRSDRTFITGNSFMNITSGVSVSESQSTEIARNVIDDAPVGIYFQFASGTNTIYENTIRNGDWGVFVYETSGIFAYHNNFIDNARQAGARLSPDARFSDPDLGGNYWSDYDTPEEGCYDADSNGLCDNLYALRHFGGIDYLPWNTQDGWETPEAILTDIIGTISTELETGGIVKSGTAKSLTSALDNALSSIEQGHINAAKNQIKAVLNHIKAQEGKSITPSTAEALKNTLTNALDKL